MFGQRPSQMLGVTVPLVALALDEALALRLLIEQGKEGKEGKERLSGGQRYVDEADLADADEVRRLRDMSPAERFKAVTGDG